jgi:hypothetical protein
MPQRAMTTNANNLDALEAIARSTILARGYATEDLVRDRLVSDTHWQALAAQWSNGQLLDFLFTVGAYVLLAGVMRSTGVEREPELLEPAEKYGARPRDLRRMSWLWPVCCCAKPLPKGRPCFLADVRQCNVGLDRECGRRMQVGARSQ